MSKETWKSLYKISSIICCLLLTVNLLNAQVTKEETIEKDFDLASSTSVMLNHSRGDIRIKKSSSNQVRAKLQIKVSAKSEEAVQQVMDKLSLQGTNTSSNTLKINSKLNIKNWSQVFGSSKIKFADGTVVKGITNLDVDLEVWIPDGLDIQVKNRYHDIDIEGMRSNVSVELYEGNLYTGDISGNMDLNLKYGKAEVGNVEHMDLILYESNLKMKNATKLKMNSKYSKHVIGNIKNPKIQSYECEFTIAQIAGLFDLDDKYSSWEINMLEDGEFSLYESKMRIEQLRSATMSSKYAKLKLGDAESLNYKLSYEDELDVKKLTNLKSANSKYAEFEINQLSGSLELMQDYESDINITSVATDFKKLSITGKYVKINMPIPNQMKYQLEADLHYGDVTFLEDKFDHVYYKEKGDKLKIKGKMKGATENSPMVYLSGYEIEAKLK